MEDKDYVINESSFEFAQLDANIHDMKFDTKPIGYMRDAFRRFCKNKGSVVAACIIFILILFAIFAPIFSPYKLEDRDNVYLNRAPFLKAFRNAGFWDGGRNLTDLNDNKFQFYRAIFTETGMNPVLKVTNENEVSGQNGTTISRNVRINTYYSVGVVIKTLSKEEFDAICKYQYSYE